MSISAQINFSAHNSGLELRGAVAAVAEAFERLFQIRQKINVNAGIGWDLLAQAEISGITAKVAAVDEEQGIVWLRMNFGPGSLMSGEGELSVWEMFKIYDGKIQAVEAFMEEVPKDTPFGWEY